MSKPNFIKFPSLENHYRQREINKWIDKYPTLVDDEFIITEKIDGSNFGIIITKDEIAYQSRGHILEPNENFFDYQNVVSEYIDDIKKLQKAFCKQMKADQITVFCELFGKGIQKRVDYGDKRYLRVISIVTDGRRHSPSGIQILLQMAGCTKLLFAPVLGVVKGLETALSFSNEFKSTINDNADDNNIAEGIVIEPYHSKYSIEHDNDISYFAIKSKNEKFKEKEKIPTSKLTAPDSAELETLKFCFKSYVNQNRMLSVFSKESDIKDIKEIGKYITLITEDAWNDFIIDFKDKIENLSNNEKTKLKKSVSSAIVALLKNSLNE